jgi:hypothetical protein
MTTIALLIIGGILCLTLAYLFDFYTEKRRDKHKVPPIYVSRHKDWWER